MHPILSCIWNAFDTSNQVGGNSWRFLLKWRRHTDRTGIRFQNSVGTGQTLFFSQEAGHILLRKNLTIKSHDGGKGGHFCHCNVISNHLPLTRGAPLVGQLSLYLDNDLSSLCSEFTKGIIALPVGHL